MRFKSIVSLIICLLLLPGSCKKEPICACGVENPQENLFWLKTITLSLWTADIYRLYHLDTEYIIITDKDLIMDGIAVVYNCQGQKLCEEGGENIGGRICNLTDPKDFWDSYSTKRILLFKIREQKIICD